MEVYIKLISLLYYFYFASMYKIMKNIMDK